MAYVLTDGEKATQRMEGQWSKSRLIVPEYHTIYTARLNGVPSSDDMVAEITFDGGSGTLSDVQADMMLYVGTSAGAYDLGMCRIRKSPIAGTFYIGETSDIVWEDDAYLTVVDDYSLWQKSIRIVSNTPRMDWDVAYSDQHEDFDPVPVMGSDKVAKLAGATVEVTLGAAADTPAWVLGSTISSRLWSISGALSIDDNTAVNPVATFNATGTYLAYCTFTAANGKTFTGVRYIVIWDDDDPHLEDFQIRNGRMNYETGACSFEVVLFSGFEKTTLRERSKVILAAEDFAGTQAITLPGPLEGSENIVCIGWISEIDTSRQAEYGEIAFRVESAEFWMRKIRDYPSGLELKIGTAAAWTDMPSLNVRRACWHFLHWRSTATRVMDVLIEDDSRLATRFVTMRANLWERVDMVAKPTIHASAGVDHLGRLFIQIDPQMVPVASRTFPVVMTLTDDDILDEITWRRRDVKALSMLFYSGVRINNSGAAASRFAMSPGHSYGHHGEEEAQDRYLVTTQAATEEACGLYYGWRNNDPFDLEVIFTNSMRVLGMWPRQYFYYEVSAGSDPRGIGYAANFIVREIGFEQDVDSGFIEYSALLEPEAVPGPSIKGDVPTMEDVDFSIPELPSLPGLPSLPPLPIISLPPSVVNPNQPTKVVIATSTHGVFWTENFSAAAASVVWMAMNNGLENDDELEIGQMVVTPSGAIYIMTEGNSTAGWNKIMRTAGVGGDWVEVWNVSSHDVANAKINGLGVNKTANDEIAFHVSVNYTAFGSENLGKLYIGGDTTFDQSGGWTKHKTMAHRTGVAFFNGSWFVIGFRPSGIGGSLAVAQAWRFSQAGALETLLDIQGASGEVSHSYLVSAGGQLLGWGDSDSGGATGYKLIPYDITGFSHVTGSITLRNAIQAAAVSPTGIMAMGCISGGTITPYKSTDTLASWQSVGGVISAGSDVWEDCGDDLRYIFGGGIVIRLTMDQGATYEDKAGNLLTIASLMDLTHARFIE
jgi:PKD repeat protein